MRKALAFFSAVFIFSCSRTEKLLDGECGGVIDYANAGLFQVELVDSNGTNLIQDGKYDPDKITASINGGSKKGVYENFDAAISRDTIRLYTTGKEGTNRWLLQLSEMDTDTLDFIISYKEERYFSDGILFCGSRHILNSASYNGKPIEITSDSEGLVIVNISVLK